MVYLSTYYKDYITVNKTHMVNSKNKGSRFERKIGAWFTEWTSFKFERNRLGSGAWHTNRDATSDITCTDPKHAHRCKLAIECKSYKDIKFEHTLLGNKGCDILKFWNQVLDDSRRSDKYPLLCIRYNSMPQEEFFFITDDSLGQIIIPYYKGNYMIIHSSSYHLYIFMASHIQKEMPYKVLHKAVKTLLKQ